MTNIAETNSEHIGNALAYGLTGNRTNAGAELSKVYSQGPQHMYTMWVALAETAVRTARGTPTPNTAFGLQALSAHGQHADIEDVPPAPRLAMRFMTAQANQDPDTTRALFRAALEGDPDVLADATSVLLDAAVAGAREAIAAHKAKEA